jgi:Flp pilus assembly protein TadG
MKRERQREIVRAHSLRWIRRFFQNEDGSSSISVVIAVPALLFLVMAIAQTGLWAYAQEVAYYAATTALDTARADGGSLIVALDQAETVLHTTAPNLLTDQHVNIHRTRTTVTVTINAHLAPVLGGVPLPVPPGEETAA